MSRETKRVWETCAKSPNQPTKVSITTANRFPLADSFLYSITLNLAVKQHWHWKDGIIALADPGERWGPEPPLAPKISGNFKGKNPILSKWAQGLPGVKTPLTKILDPPLHSVFLSFLSRALCPCCVRWIPATRPHSFTGLSFIILRVRSGHKPQFITHAAERLDIRSGHLTFPADAESDCLLASNFPLPFHWQKIMLDTQHVSWGRTVWLPFVTAASIYLLAFAPRLQCELGSWFCVQLPAQKSSIPRL